MPRLNVDSYTSDEGYAQEVRSLVSQGIVGGFCIFQGIPEAVVGCLQDLHGLRRSAGLPRLLFSADCEFGLPMRLTTGGTEFPDAMALARADHEGQAAPAFDVAHAIGTEMRALGIDWNFAPVADINSNPANPIINTRSFGETADVVSRNAVAYHLGLRAAGVLSTAKHFPGHGDTSQDSHRELPYIDRTLEEFEERELRPFRALIEAGVDSVMTGHLAAPTLLGDLCAGSSSRKLPATLSKTLTTTLLRERLGFNGVIVTDALEMGAITDSFGAAEAPVLAFEAGADVILLPIDARQAHVALLEYAAQSEACRVRVEESVARLSAMTASVPDLELSLERFHEQADESDRLSRRLAVEAISVHGALRQDVSTLLILVDDRPRAVEKAAMLSNALGSCFGEVRMQKFGEEILVEGPYLLATLHRARGYIGGSTMAVDANRALHELARTSGHNCAGIVMIGSPYVDRDFQQTPPFILRTYSESATSVEAAAKVIAGLK